MNLKKFTLGLSGALVTIIALNFVRVYMPFRAASQNNDLTAVSYYRFGVVPDSIVFDLWGVGPNESHASVMGAFLRFADEMKDRDFREVRLAYRGDTRFILGGRDFADIGREHEWQNPVFTLRTFPEKLKTTDGRDAFSTWTGGMLGVMSSQMDDLNQLRDEWYFDDMVRYN
jgi:hypothetical protein